jgi:inner membrane protein
VTDVAARSLEAQGIAYSRLLSTPAPFNTLLWRFVAMHPDGSYSEGYYSLFDGPGEVHFDRHDSKVALLDAVNGELAGGASEVVHARLLQGFAELACGCDL